MLLTRGLSCLSVGVYRNNDIQTLRREAEYYGITPLVNRLTLCSELTSSSCGGVLFHGFIPPPESSLSIVDHLDQFRNKHAMPSSSTCSSPSATGSAAGASVAAAGDSPGMFLLEAQ